MAKLEKNAGSNAEYLTMPYVYLETTYCHCYVRFDIN